MVLTQQLYVLMCGVALLLTDGCVGFGSVRFGSIRFGSVRFGSMFVDQFVHDSAQYHCDICSKHIPRQCDASDLINVLQHRCAPQHVHQQHLFG
jgi:hypothetical protein